MQDTNTLFNTKW